MIEYLLRKLLKNFGKVTPDIYRSGQPGFIRRWITYKLFPYGSVMNLAASPSDRQDADESLFCRKRGIEYYAFTWGAGGPNNKLSVQVALNLLKRLPKPILIHCEGGRDRTGGLVGIWKREFGYSWESICGDFAKHGLPAEGWLEAIFE